MKAAPFDYVAPVSVEEAVAALAAANGDARILSGGQTLGPMLNMRLAMPKRLVDVGRIGAFKRIAEGADRLLIGAGVTHATIEDRADPSPLGRLLAHVAGTIAYRAIRNRGTIGGSLAHADPAADWATVMMLLGAEVLIAGPAGRRRVPMREFMKGAFSTALGPADVVEAVEIVKHSPEARWGYYKVCRKAGEFPDAIGAALFDPARGIARIIVGALDGPPKALPELAARVAREGAAAAAIDHVRRFVAAAAPDLDAIDLQIHAAAVRRAIFSATAR
jgi:carbon-monoxide dehydrogenase medium subunit